MIAIHSEKPGIGAAIGKARYRCFYLVMGAVALFIMLASLPASGQSPAGPSREYIWMNGRVAAIEIAGNAAFSINNSTTGSFHVGDAWTLRLQTNIRNASFNLCTASGCTANYGTTAADGSWTLSSHFSSGDVGSWQKWAVFPGVGTSNAISYTVTN